MELDLRGVMRHFATGVGVVSTHTAAPDAPGARRHDAITVNSLALASYDPPLVSLCLRRESAFLADLLAAKVWAVSILGADGAETAGALARGREHRGPVIDSLPATTGGQTGALILSGLGWLECALSESFVAGDHLMVIGEVLACGVTEARDALVFLNGALRPALAAR
ncbi:flavin reductase family protein [Kitasatospora viridis]|uniref:Flavin reductase (DIM6/NTAB) family NADH-FMN oxidoreductase RutF n=1 Tax=Kitasatospora viridis TaxID=281105 RepID=A0A561TTI8_9ACTN|nr:flavin reductase family protein [Kitasatospora viridis]TWF90430.1 flavin reductase (DIM6/NTAB) family NADH-FMN oxidoreductase RutF [Kitasatospora viridis]